jgi:hypothetical protein
MARKQPVPPPAPADPDLAAEIAAARAEDAQPGADASPAEILAWLRAYRSGFYVERFRALSNVQRLAIQEQQIADLETEREAVQQLAVSTVVDDGHLPDNTRDRLREIDADLASLRAALPELRRRIEVEQQAEAKRLRDLEASELNSERAIRMRALEDLDRLLGAAGVEAQKLAAVYRSHGGPSANRGSSRLFDVSVMRAALWTNAPVLAELLGVRRPYGVAKGCTARELIGGVDREIQP